MKAKRVLILVHPNFRPDRGARRPGTERDVWLALQRLGHTVRILGVRDDLAALARELELFRPHIVFNLLEEFRGEAVFDFHLVAYLEARGIPYTGCNPRGLILSRDKFLVGQIVSSLGVRAPRAHLLGEGSGLAFPRFVKLNREHASMGIRDSNCVRTPAQFKRVCERMREYGSEILIQEYIDGEDVSVSVWGNRRAEAFLPRKLGMGSKSVSTSSLKFNRAFQKRHRVRSLRYAGGEKLAEMALRVFRALDLSGYARLDFRVSDEAYLIDVNANPNLVKHEDFALSALSAGWTYLDKDYDETRAAVKALGAQ